MAFNFVPEFFILKEGKLLPLPGHLTGLHGLAKFQLNMYLTEYGYETTDAGKAKFIMETVDSAGNEGYSYFQSLPLIAAAIFAEYTIKKKKGHLHMSNRDKKHVEYTIMKELESILIEFKAE